MKARIGMHLRTPAGRFIANKTDMLISLKPRRCGDPRLIFRTGHEIKLIDLTKKHLRTWNPSDPTKLQCLEQGSSKFWLKTAATNSTHGTQRRHSEIGNLLIARRGWWGPYQSAEQYRPVNRICVKHLKKGVLWSCRASKNHTLALIKHPFTRG